jgi:hypothetical protein
MITISQHQFRRWSKRFSELDLQIFRLSLACDVNLAQVGVVDNVLMNINTVCGKDKPRVFVTLRALLMLRYALQTTAVAELGSSGVLRIANYTQVWLRERIGGNAK